ncbi:monovalent cation/H(+) antiporter subunit G [Mesotoga sp. BH458_6_3_2_1]|uniref:monovalent cation/H(+) antiporter subunit G n=2 Tax=Mesotoga TaxID=1184396 RepID=UPI000EF2605D|nr:monovalent cation/H(+) antiporter subunit G [Mesotoga sp. BH458_6_3_2_1]MDI9368787.1 monovalent cation/H(+) antiporter subunit G [Thermotogota bacterium]
MIILDILGYALLSIGAFFFFMGGLGMLRMPDVFNRLQAGTKATTLGSFSVILGVGLINPQWLLKTVIIVAFIAITNPVGSSAIARTALKKGITPIAYEESHKEADGLPEGGEEE